MRGIILLTFGLAIAYSGYWAIGRQDRAADVIRLEAQFASRGIDLSYDVLATRGFPSRFDTRAEGLSLASDKARWDLPELEVAALSYQPRNLIATFPEAFMLTVGGRKIDVTASRMRASADLAASEHVEEIRFEISDLTVDSLATAVRAFAALRARGDGSFDAYLEVNSARLSLGPVDLPVDSFRADARLIPVAGGFDLEIRSASGSSNGASIALEGRLSEGLTLTGNSPVALLLGTSGALKSGPLPLDLWWMLGG